MRVTYLFLYFQIHLLEPDLLKTEPIDIPLKKAKLDEYAAYIYAAAMDPLYIHAAMYDQWSNRQMSAFRPVPNTIFSKDSKTRHAHPSIRYKDPPILQNPERVIPISETERFERTFQPNVALAPPKKHIEIIAKEEQYTQKDIIEDSPRIDQSKTVITKDYSQQNGKNDTAIVDSTVSVVQSTNQQRYNEIELSTDTDDSLSDSSENNRQISNYTRLTETLSEIPTEIKERVLNLVRDITKQHEQVLLQCQEKDERISQLERKLKEMETLRKPDGLQGSVLKESEYDVSSSRAEIPTEEQNSIDIIPDISAEMVSSGTEEIQNSDCEEISIVQDNTNSVILAINSNANEKIEAIPDSK